MNWKKMRRVVFLLILGWSISCPLAAHYSYHPGGPKVSEPGVRWYDFELAELSVGFSCAVYF